MEIIFRFLAVSVTNTLFGLSVYWLLLYIGLNFQWATALSLALGVVFSFNNHRVLVFKINGGFIRYIVVWFFIYIVNITLISILRNNIGDYIAGIILMPLNAFLAFMLMKLFVFRKINGQGT